MPITIAKLAAKLSKVVIDLGDGDTIEFRWRVGLMNDETSAEYLAINDTPEVKTIDDARVAVKGVSGKLDAFLIKLVQSWDILDEDGTMFPITAERLPELAYVWRNKVMNALMADAREANAGEATASEPQKSAPSDAISS